MALEVSGALGMEEREPQITKRAMPNDDDVVESSNMERIRAHFKTIGDSLQDTSNTNT